MINIINSTYPVTKFNAVWNNENKHLEETFFERVTRTFFFIINHIIKSSLLPVTTYPQVIIESINCRFQTIWSDPQFGHRLLMNQFTPTPIEVMTPDGVKICGTHFKNRAALDNAPTIICLQPNGMIGNQGAFDWLLEQAALQEFPYNFVYFDYRGCGDSEGSSRSAKDLFLDGESIYQLVRDKYHVPEKDIHLYGWSLGAGVGANVKSIHAGSEGRYVNERSFSSINDVLNNIMHWFPAAIAKRFLSFLNWNIESTTAVQKLKGKTLIVHHPADELVKGQASLFRSLFQGEMTASPKIRALDLSRSPDSPAYFIHGTPIEAFKDNRFNPVSEISQFLFNSNQTLNQRMVEIFRNSSSEFRNRVYATVARKFQQGGLYYGSGEDACLGRNGLSLSESQLAEAVMTAKRA